MLNYIWFALIVIGIGVALYNDVNDFSSNKYRNDEEDIVSIQLSPPATSLEPKTSYPCTVTFRYSETNATDDARRRILRDEVSPNQPQRAELIPADGNHGILHIFIDGKAPLIWKDRFRIQKNADFLAARVRWGTDAATGLSHARLTFDPVKFVMLNAVTNDGIIKYVKTAVELAIGLIGIMALWLGLMKIAEQSGLVASIAKGLRPITTRLFPDVPADHPAMGAMIMNISANMLGLANAATPLGLKAMEELNKLSKKAGTATDAMCTFLVINTSNVQLIPATVIALRAAAGSANPTEILGPVIVATTVNTIAGVITVKLLAKLPVFKRQLEAEEVK